MNHQGSYASDVRDTRPRRGFCGLIGVLLLLAVAAAACRSQWPVFRGKAMTGKLRNAVAIRGADGGPLLWILTDGSFRYAQRTQTPGRTSIEAKCLFCKTWTYVYDPVRKTVRAKFRTNLKKVLSSTWMAYSNGKVWVAYASHEDDPPRILVYDADPPRLIHETGDVLARFPELRSGLVGLRLAENPDRLLLDTRDGRSGLALSLSDEKLYPSEDALKETVAGEDERVTALALGIEDNGPRRRLFKVTGPRSTVTDSSLDFMLRDPRSLFMARKVSAEPLSPERHYIEGVAFYQDAEGCLILHQDAAGNKAKRMLTRVGMDGKEKWTTPSTALFQELRVDIDKEALSGIFFMKDHIRVSRTGGLVLLQLEDVGMIGIDFDTGRKLWEVRL